MSWWIYILILSYGQKLHAEKIRLQIQKRKEDSFKVSLGSAVVPQPGKELVVGMVLLFDLDRG